MSLSFTHLFATLTLLALSVPTAFAAVLSVDDDGDDLPTAQYRTIHEALTAAQSGDEIIVHPGTYYAPIHIDGKNVNLHSIDPNDSHIVRTTIIDGQNLDSAVIFSGTEDETCILNGFTITRGLSLSSGGGIHGGDSRACRATIRNNLIQYNEAAIAGGGLANCSGLIINNTISNNIAYSGGGLANCNSPGIENNSITANEATEGGGLYACNGPLRKNHIANNKASADGGGLKNCRGLIQGNAIRDNTAGDGGGLIFCSGDVIDNIITGNTATGDGGALHTCGGTIQGNTIESNQALDGAGLFQCNATIESNHLQSNTALHAGGALFECNATILTNQFIENSAKSIGGAIFGGSDITIRLNVFTQNQSPEGAAIADCLAQIDSNRFLGNRAKRGGALIRCQGAVRNNLFAANRAIHGAAVAECRGQYLHNTFAHNRLDTPSGATIALATGSVFRDNIFYRNDHLAFTLDTPAEDDPALNFIFRNDFFGHDIGLLQIGEALPFETADTLNSQLDWCDENRLVDPQFADPDGPDGQPDSPGDNNYRLTPSSPAIDRASIHILSQLPVYDLDSLGRWTGNAPDLGCFEHDSGPDTDGDGLVDSLELSLGSDAESIDTDGDGLIDSLESRRGTSPTHPDTGSGLQAPMDFPTLQETVLMAFNGESVVLQPGIYYESINLTSKSIRLSGESPTDPQIADLTIIDAASQGPVLTMDGSQDERMMIEGLTLRGGYATIGSAILGKGAPATLRLCVINGNIAETGGTVHDLDGPITDNRFENNTAWTGGALAHGLGPITGNVMRGNSARTGGAIYKCEGTIQGNTIEANAARFDGGGLAECYGEIHHNTITANSAVRGGGLFNCNKAIYENLIQGNEARNGGGLYQCHNDIYDNRILNNKAKQGGGLYQCHGDILRNDITGNTADFNGGGLSSCRGSIRYNTISGNQAYTGGGLVLCDAPIEFNQITDNIAKNNGGGIAICGKAIRGNLIKGNQASNGGAIAFTDTLIQNNMIIENSAVMGGGFYNCNDRIDANTIRDNTASGGGGAFSISDGIIQNNLILGNTAQRGGAMDQCHAIIHSNTLVGNAAPTGGTAGGLLNCSATISNNIFSYNRNVALATDDAATTPPEVSGNCFFNNWDGLLLEPDGSRSFDLEEIEDAHPNFFRNLQVDPLFADILGPDKLYDTFADNDYRLQPGSPCIDQALNIDAAPINDRNGVSRPLDGNGDNSSISDLGALEFFAVTLLRPDGPTRVYAGGLLKIEWENQIHWAGEALRFELWHNAELILSLGEDWNPQGRGSVTFALPVTLTPGDGYRLLAISTWDSSLRAVNNFLRVLPPNTAAGDWLLYH